MSQPPWNPPRALLRADPLPDRADVLVLGCSLAGLAAAEALAGGGATVALVGEGALGGFASRSAGLVQQGLGEHPHRLVSSVGLDEARAMHRFLVEDRQELVRRGLLDRCGQLVVAAMDLEAEELIEHSDTPARLGQRAEAWTAEQVNRALNSEGFGPGRLLPDDGQVEPLAVEQALARSARQAGARLSPGTALGGLRRGGQGLALETSAGPVQADEAVLAAGWRLAALDDWFGDKLYPVRHQWIATAPVALGRLPCPVSAQQGFSHWRQLSDGRILAGGARFGSPHLEAGETDANVLHPKVDHILRANLVRFFPDLAGVEISHAWSAIATHSCDGLPILGPLPGRPSLVACTGFHGLDHSLALWAGQIVAQGLLTGRAPQIPRYFRAGRMV